MRSSSSGQQSSSPICGGRQALWKVVTRFPIVIGAATLTASAWLAWFYFSAKHDDLGGIHHMQLLQDERITRMSEHCAATLEGDEGAFSDPSDPTEGVWKLSGVAIIASPGDTSPLVAWPDEPDDAVFWSCKPQALPRHWRMNQNVDFEVIDGGTTRTDHTFQPEFVEREVAGEHEMVCGKGQLTGVGFNQMAALGRYLADAYDEHFMELSDESSPLDRFVIRSVDNKRSLAAAAGILMTLLASPSIAEAFTEGTVVPIVVDPNLTRQVPLAYADSERGAEHFLSREVPKDSSSRSMLGDHLLGRWCRRLSWPCSGAFSCLDMAEAAKVVAEGEAALCQHLSREEVRSALAGDILAHIERLHLQREWTTFGTAVLVVTEGRVLTSLLATLVSTDVCSNALLSRPPYGSRLVVERWCKAESSCRWRLLFNGEDMTPQMEGCGAAAGCEEAVMLAHLRTFQRST
eukprot:TRINITY_DN49439_c0_g1_i2.p1 TRINITY_DN49439_c0_g1~~TRINITY_DN49439_c0_g1_i2.p1  ORF type:complete len:462 (-),score=51.95 TRINITY_DN49439_c0_g1_i2:392-1777(-)